MKAIVLMASLIFTTLQGQASQGPNYYEEFTKNQVTSLMQRWWLFYETPTRNFEHQLDLFTEEFTVESPRGQANRRNFVQRIQSIPLSDKNAHHLLDLKIEKIEGDKIYASAVIEYQRLRGEELVGYTVNYSLEALIQKTGLPKIQYLSLYPGVEIKKDKYVDRYLENRMGSTITYFSSLFDRPLKTAAPFEELFVENVTWQSPSAKLTSLKEFSNWYSTIHTRVKQSFHKPFDIEITSIEGQKYKVRFKYDFQAELQNGKTMSAISQHEWVVEDTTGRYPKIHSVKVDFIHPPKVQ